MTEHIRAHSVDHEHWHIAMARCACGGSFVPGAQGLAFEGETPLDRIQATCRTCHGVQEFVFDISPFYGRAKQLSEIEAALSCVDEKTRKKILRRLGPPMPRAVEFIQQLANDGDESALRYLQERVAAALSVED
jgi:hypothetical protein